MTDYAYPTASNRLSYATIGEVAYAFTHDASGHITRYDACSNGAAACADAADTFIEWNTRGLATEVTLGASAEDAAPTARDAFFYGPADQQPVGFPEAFPGEPVEHMNETDARHSILHLPRQKGGDGLRHQRTQAAARPPRPRPRPQLLDQMPRDPHRDRLLYLRVRQGPVHVGGGPHIAARLHGGERVAFGQQPNRLGRVTVPQLVCRVQPFGALLHRCARHGSYSNAGT